MSEPRGAGRSGGLLFVVVMVVLGFLAIQAIAGLIRWAIGTVVLIAIVALVLRVLGRR